MEDVFEAGQRQVAEFMAKLATRPVSARYPVATESSITARGGRVTASSPYSTTGGRVALVGDTVCYADGTEARIVSGAGAVLGHQGRPVALVGSALDNGDTIEGPLHEGMVIVQYADVPPIEGLLDPNYVSSRSHGASHEPPVCHHWQQDHAWRHGDQRRLHQRHLWQSHGARG